MAELSKIEWADSTLNLWFGCTKVSPACDHCYAESWAKRSGLAGWGPHAPRVQAKHWREQLAAISRRALAARRPWFVFVNSLSDVFDNAAEDAWRAAAFAAFRAHPHVTFLLVTKRIGNAEAMIAAAGGLPPNCAVLITVIDQAEADRDIPKLLVLKARLRPAFVGVSIEPMLGPVDLTAWIPPRSPWPLANAPATWAEFEWPEWIPDRIRKQIEGFWAEKWGRGPKAWIRDMASQGAPPTGAIVDVHQVRSGSPTITGRYVHAWNNIGWVMREDGGWKVCSFGRSHGRPLLDWAIVGGESGHQARPIHRGWVRAIRDQCAAAGVAFLFKQWGEHRPVAWGDEEAEDALCDLAIAWNGAVQREKPFGLPDIGGPKPRWSVMSRVGKKAAGRLLDGVTHDARPRVAA